MSANPLHRLLNPKTIATVGSGNNFMKMGTMHAISIMKDGYSGKLFPVHPRDKSVLGVPAYSSIESLPETPDLALLVVPSDQVVRLIEDFGKKGTTSAIIISAGFAEMGSEGSRMQNELNEISAKYGIRFLGPNCMGIINTEISLNTTVMPYNTGPGSFGFASQSGTYVTQTIAYLASRGIRFSKAISVGNSANIDITDALEYLGEDEQTRAISLYIEGIKDVQRFIEVARSITPRKPVLAQYVGGTGAGARSGMSHTGSMAAPDHLFDGLFRQAGIIRVHTIEDLYNYGNMLAVQPAIGGKRIGVLTNSGGPGSAMADTLERGGLEVPEFSEGLQEKIRQLLQPHAPCGNPVDMTFDLNLEALTRKIPSLMLESGEVDGIVIHGAMRTGWLKAGYPHFKDFINNKPLDEFISALPDNGLDVTAISRFGKPIVISSFFGREDSCIEAYEDGGIPVFDSPEKAAGAMAMLLRHKEVRERKLMRRVEVPAPPAAAIKMIADCLTRGDTNLDEHGSKLFLKSWGIPVTEEKTAGSAEEAASIAQEIGFPVVMKASAGDILHKTGKGLIYLDLKSADEAVSSYKKIQEAAGRKVPVIIYRMVKGEREFVAGIVRAPGFGPSVMFGLGGILTEALGDAAFRPAPLSEDDAAEMINDIRARKLLGAFRGMAPVNMASLARLVHRLSLIPAVHPEVREIDINPVIIEGAEPVAVDALVIFGAPMKK